MASKSSSASTSESMIPVTVMIKRRGLFIKFTAQSKFSDMPILKRCAEDAADIVECLMRRIAKDGYNSGDTIAFDMGRFRSICRHRGYDEENLCVDLVEDFLTHLGNTVKACGFENDNGKVTDPDTLYIIMTK